MEPATQDPPQSSTTPATTSPATGAGNEPPPASATESWGWTRRQRIGLGMLLSLLLIVLTIQYIRRPFRLDEGAVLVNGTEVTLPQRIDPNTADERELSRVPHIGETLAAKIIEWRDARKPTAPGGIVFRQPGDLDPIPGIGKKLIAEMQPFLKFPDDAPTTEP